MTAKAAPPPAPTRGKGKKTGDTEAAPGAHYAVHLYRPRAALALANRRWYAATDAGILHSDNEGASWSGGAIEEEKSFFSVSAHDQMVVAASVSGVWVSANYAQHWLRQPLPPEVTRVYSVTITQDDAVWLSTREGAFRWIRTIVGRRRVGARRERPARPRGDLDPRTRRSPAGGCGGAYGVCEPGPGAELEGRRSPPRPSRSPEP